MYRLLLSVSTFFVLADLHTSAGRLCFAQMSRVSLSFIIPPSVMTGRDYFFGRLARPLTADYRREKLPLGTAERRSGAARLKICVRTLLLLLYFGAYRGWPLFYNERTPVASVFFGHESILINEDGIYNTDFRDFVHELTFSVKSFSEIAKKTLGYYFQ